MVGTTPSVDTYRDIAVTLVLVKVYNRVQKMRAHVIILYFHLVNNISMQLLNLKWCHALYWVLTVVQSSVNFDKSVPYLKYPEITHSGKPTSVHALRHRLFLNVGAAQLIRSTLNNLFHFRFKQPAWCDKTSQWKLLCSKVKRKSSAKRFYKT